MKIRLILAGVLLVALAAAASSRQEPPLRLYLPRQVQIDGEQMTLEHIAVIRCEQPALAQRAGAVAMGRTPWMKETIVIDRTTILARLASCGIAQQDVTITGADRVSITRSGTTVPAEDLLAAAREFLAADAADGARYVLVRECGDLRIPPAQDVELKASFAKDAPAGQARVLVAALSGQRELGAVEVLFKREYSVRQAVAAREIAAGEKISPENARLEIVASDRPAAAGWQVPFGMLATQRISAGTVIRPDMAAAPKPALLVERDQTVLMRIDGAGFVVTAVGQALEPGRAGQFIKVRNIDTKRVIVGRVEEDGTVRPLMQNEVSK